MHSRERQHLSGATLKFEEVSVSLSLSFSCLPGRWIPFDQSLSGRRVFPFPHLIPVFCFSKNCLVCSRNVTWLGLFVLQGTQAQTKARSRRRRDVWGRRGRVGSGGRGRKHSEHARLGVEPTLEGCCLDCAEKGRLFDVLSRVAFLERRGCQAISVSR